MLRHQRLDLVEDRRQTLHLVHDGRRARGVGVLAEPGTASNMIVTVKRRVRAALEKHVEKSVMAVDEAGEELQDMARFFPKLAQNLK